MHKKERDHRIFNNYLLNKSHRIACSTPSSRTLWNRVSSWNQLGNLLSPPPNPEPFGPSFSVELQKISLLFGCLLIDLKQAGFFSYPPMFHRRTTRLINRSKARPFRGNKGPRGVNVQGVWFHKKPLNSPGFLPMVWYSPIARNFWLFFPHVLFPERTLAIIVSNPQCQKKE